MLAVFYLKFAALELTDADIESVMQFWKREIEEDPLTLLDPPSSSTDGGEFKIFKGFARDTGLFVATLTGSFLYTDSDTHWAWLHEGDGIHCYEPHPAAEAVVRLIASQNIEVPTSICYDQMEPAAAGETRVLLRNVALALQAAEAFQATASVCAEAVCPPIDERFLRFKLRASIPLGGFQRTDVSRLVLTFGRFEEVATVRLAIFLEPIPDGDKGDAI